MPKRREVINRDENKSSINIQKVNNGLFLDLTEIAKEHGQQLPTFLRPYLREIKERFAHLLKKPKID